VTFRYVALSPKAETNKNVRSQYMNSCRPTTLPAELRYHLNPQANRSNEGFAPSLPQLETANVNISHRNARISSLLSHRASHRQVHQARTHIDNIQPHTK